MTISVIMSVHNGIPYVENAIQSILAQTYRDVEFLIVDDGSTDGSAELLADFAKRDSRVRMMTNEVNLGLTKSLNKVLRQTQGICIARMDADDIALPSRLEKQWNFLRTHPEIGMVGTTFEWINDTGALIGQPTIMTETHKLHSALIRTNPFLHGSILIRKTLLDEVHGYNEKFTKAQDYDLWLRLSSLCQFANIPEILMQKRMNKTMISFQDEREQMRFAVKARWDAIGRNDYPVWTIIYLVKPFIASLLPLPIVRWARIHLFGQKIYAHSALK